jgi:hypothetical protein
MKKILFVNDEVRIEARGNKLMVVAYSRYAGETKTYYIAPTKDFTKTTDYASKWNEDTCTWQALLYVIRQQRVHATTTKDYAVI